MQSFLFLRHGETDWNVQNRMQGQIQSVPLNANGMMQARQAAVLLARVPFDLIVCSTLDRAIATAQIIGESVDVPIHYDQRLIERSWGVAEGLTHEEFSLQQPDQFYTEDGGADWIANTRHPKGAETRDELADRAIAAVEDLLAAHRGRRLLLVTHGAWMRALAFRLTGKDQIFSNATPYQAVQDDGLWQISPL